MLRDLVGDMNFGLEVGLETLRIETRDLNFFIVKIYSLPQLDYS